MDHQWAVVFFTDHKTYSEIPVSWLTKDRNHCWWPKTVNATQFMLKGEIPDERKWTLYDIVVETYCASIESARKRADNSDYSSSQEQTAAMGRRMRKKKNQYDDYSSGDLSEELTPPPSPTNLESVHKNKESVQKNKESVHKNKESVHQNNESVHKNKEPLKDSGVIVIATGDPPQLVNFEEPTVLNQNYDFTNIEEVLDEEETRMGRNNSTDLSLPSIENVYSLLVRLTTVCCSIEKHMKDVTKNIQNLHSVEGNITVDNFMKVLRQRLPLKTQEELVTFNNELENSATLKKTFISYMKSIGGKDVRDNTNRCLAANISNDLGVQCSWFGQRGNIRVSDFTCMSILVDMLVCQYSTVQVKICEVQKHINEWFRLSKQRLQREKK